MYNVAEGSPDGTSDWRSMWGSFVSDKWITVPSTHTYDTPFPIFSWETDIFSPWPRFYRTFGYGQHEYLGSFGAGILADISASSATHSSYNDWHFGVPPGNAGPLALSDDIEWTDLWIAAVNGSTREIPGFSGSLYLTDSRRYRGWYSSFGTEYYLLHDSVAPMIPTCMLKRMASNPYYTVNGIDVSGTGFYLDTPHFYPDHLGKPLYAPNARADMPLHNPLMTTNGLVISLEYNNSIGVPESDLIPPAGFLDTYTDVPGNLWVRLAFSSDGAGANPTSSLIKVDLPNTNGNFLTLEIPISSGSIGGNEYIDEIDLYWKRPHAYFQRTNHVGPYYVISANPFPTPWHVIMRGNTSIREFKVNVA